MHIGPSPEYCAAARYVLGGDSLAHIIDAIRRGGPLQLRVALIHNALVDIKDLNTPGPADISDLLDDHREYKRLSKRDRHAIHELACALKASEPEPPGVLFA